MQDLSLRRMLEMQYALWERNKENWQPLTPENARNQLLWMMGEIGEVIDIIKKTGEARIMADDGVKDALTLEMCDVLMYFNDILLCLDIQPEVFEEAYRQKHEKNMNRNYPAEAEKFTAKLQGS